MIIDGGVEARFWAKVDKCGPVHPVLGTRCWTWVGATDSAGAGLLRVARSNKRASRIAFQIAFGDFNEKMLVCHECDNPSCCNPNHLWLGSQLDNMRDCSNKGRISNHKRPSGETHKSSKLSAEQVIAIRAEYVRGSGQLLALRFGVTRTTIMNIVRFKFRKEG